MFMKLKMSLHILQEICAPLLNVTHHLKPASITHAHRSVWPFVTFPFGVVCIFFFARVPENLDMLSCGPGFDGRKKAPTMLVFSWKAAVLIFIAIQKHTAQK